MTRRQLVPILSVALLYCITAVVTMIVHAQEPTPLPDKTVIAFLKASLEYQSAVSRQCSTLLNAVQQVYGSTAEPQLRELQKQQAALQQACGDKAILKGLDETPPNPRCEPKPEPKQ